MAHTSNWWRHAPALRFLSAFLLLWAGLRLCSPVVMQLLSDEGHAYPVAIELHVQDDAAHRMIADQWPPQPHNGGEQMSSAEPATPLYHMPPAFRHAAFIARRVTAELPRAIPAISGAGQQSPSLAAAGDPYRQNVDGAIRPRARTSARPVMEDAAAAIGLVHPGADDPADTGNAAAILSPFSRQMAGWSLSLWALVRENGGAPSQLPVVGELAGSQGGLRLAYGFGEDGRLRAYGRVSMALERTQQREAAFGVTYAPLPAVPIDFAVERRVRLGREGRSAMAVMLVGGVTGKSLPQNFRLDGYGQAGVVGVRSQDMFADGALVIDRGWNLQKEARSPRIGAVVAGSAQPELSRLDVGPRITLPLPDIGKGARVAVDWRHRIAGNARPDGGLALTLGADF